MLNVPERKKVRRLQQRTDYASEWLRVDPILADGEFGVERDTRLFKIGDGVLKWSELTYGGGASDITALISTKPDNKLQLVDGKMYVQDDVVVDYVEIYNDSKS